jgi:hypothetical protein
MVAQVGLEECALCTVLGVLRARCWVSLVHRIGCPASIMFGVVTDTLLPRWDWKIDIVYILCIYMQIGKIYVVYIKICLYYCVYIYEYA